MRGRPLLGKRLKYATSVRTPVHRGTSVRRLSDRELGEFRDRIESILAGNRKLYHGTL